MNTSVEKEIHLTSVDPKATIEAAEKDMNMLSGLLMADSMIYLFPRMFLLIWEFLKSKIHLTRDFSCLALGIPRGFAKTTVIKIFICFVILFTIRRFPIVISYNEDHAISIIKDVCTMLSSSNIVALFGDWQLNQEIDQAALKIFKFRGRKIILKAVGAKGGIRGINHDNERPDLMIFEDYQRKDDSENEELSNALYKEMLGTAMKACSPFGCLFIFVANMYPTTGSILKKLKNNKDWTSFIVGAILADGTSLWEDLQPLTQLLEEYERDLNAGHPEIFLAEKLNDESAGIKAGIDITKIPKNPFTDEYEVPQGRAIMIDPALDNPTSDYNGIGLMGLYDGIPVLEKADLGRYSPLELIKRSIILALQTNTRLICVENVAYQASLLFWFSKVCTDNGIEGFHFMPLKIGGGSKNAKIAAMLKELVKKEIFIADEIRPLAVNEIIKWNPMKKNNQDTVLDLLTFCKKVIEQFGELMYMPLEQDMLGVSGAAPRSLAENCSF